MSLKHQRATRERHIVTVVAMAESKSDAVAQAVTMFLPKQRARVVDYHTNPKQPGRYRIKVSVL